MAIKRDSLRAERDFYAPMTGGTQIRYSDAPTGNRDTYSSQVKSRLAEIGQGQRRAAPIISAIKTRMRKTDDPFTQVGQQKSYAPQQEENQIGAQIDAAASQAEEVISEGVAQAETAVEEYRKGSSQKAAERRAQRQQERQSDLKARKAAADERAALRGDMKKLFARDKRMYGNTVPKGSMGSGSKPGPAVDTRPRHAEGGPGDQPKVSKFEKPKRGVGQGSSVAVLGRTTRRQGEKPTGPAVKVTNYKDIRKARLDRREKARQAKKEGTQKAVNASSFQQKNLRGARKDESARPKQVANLPSNYKATEAKAFAEAKAFKERQARAKAAKAKATKVKQERARAQAAAAKAKSEGKTKAQQAAAARKAAGPNRTMSFGQKTRAQAGPSARTAAGNRARVKANARKRAQAAAKKRKAKKAAAKKSAPKKRAPRKTRTRTARRRGRRRGRRRCDIMLKFDISLLTNNNLRHDELAEVAYFVRALRELD